MSWLVYGILGARSRKISASADAPATSPTSARPYPRVQRDIRFPGSISNARSRLGNPSLTRLVHHGAIPASIRARGESGSDSISLLAVRSTASVCPAAM